jgi:hypothetical protein
MENTILTDKAAAVATQDAPGADDLSAEIVRIIPREAREHVTCRQITPNHYRCNWWRPESLANYDNPRMQGLLVTTNRICRSSFLRVTKGDGGKLIMTPLRGNSSRSS